MSLLEFSDELLLDIAENCGTDSDGANRTLESDPYFVDQLEAHNISSPTWAVSSGYLPLVKLLLNTEADASVQNTQGYTALRYAVFNNDAEMVGLLLQCKGTNINHQSCLLQTPLHCAAYHAREGFDPELLIRLLIGRGADISLPGYRGHKAYQQAQSATAQVKSILNPEGGLLIPVGKGVVESKAGLLLDHMI